MVLLFFLNDPAPTEIYTLSLHDALPISSATRPALPLTAASISTSAAASSSKPSRAVPPDRKSTRLNSSHTVISYAVFCLKKKKKKREQISFSVSFVYPSPFSQHSHPDHT